MDTILWFVIFIIVFLFVALVLPSQYPERPVKEMERAMKHRQLKERKATCEVIGPCKRPCRYNSLNAEKSRYNHHADIDQQFMLNTGSVPDDYPAKPIGCCPYGRPLSRDLPVADAPMYKATANDNMYLSS